MQQVVKAHLISFLTLSVLHLCEEFLTVLKVLEDLEGVTYMATMILLKSLTPKKHLWHCFWL